MSTMMRVKCRCFVCGAESEHSELMSTNAFGSPDLDLRPPEMRRSTMPVWIQECPHCGYISGNIGDKTSVDQAFFKSQEYKTCSQRAFGSALAKRFYRYYLINLADENYEDAFFAVLHAAWSCDDVGDEENAAYCRKCAITEIDKMISSSQNETLKVQKADLLRRIGNFDAVINEYSGMRFEEPILQKIVAFQIGKARQQDTGCYTVADVTD